MKSVVFAGADRSQPQRGVVSPLMFVSAVVVVVMMVGALLAPSYNSLLVSAGELSARELVDTSAVSAQEQALRDQLAAVGDGLVLDDSASTIDARFMLAGPAFTQGETPFSVATSTYQGLAVEAVAPVADGDRILYERGEVTEWWQAVGSSYQQGWTVAAAPADGSTDLSLLVGFGNAAPTAESATTVRLTLADGSSVWYRDLVAFDANGTDLPATMTVDGSNVRIDVDAAGAVYPVTIDPLVDSLQEVLAPATATGDLFGEAIATDGNRMAVSAREADRPNVPDAGTDRGRVDVFEWDSPNWILLDSVDYPGTGSADFGWSVDINGNFLVVGAPLDDTNGANAGAAFIYEYDGADYNLTDTLYACDQTIGGSCDGSSTGNFAGANFGYDVGIASNKTTIVGAPGDAITDVGEAYIFAPTGVGGALEVDEEGVFTLFAFPTPNPGDRLGEAVDITDDGLLVVAGAPGDDTDATDEGRAYFGFEQVPGNYDQVGSSVGPSNTVSQEYGASVAIGRASVTNDGIAVIGMPHRSRRNPDSTGFGGIEVVNVTNGAATVGLGDISAFTVDDGFGYDVAFANDTVMTGGPFNSPGGVVYAYTYLPAGNTMDNGGAGASAQRLNNASDTFNQPGDAYGSAVAVAETPNFLIGGSPGHDETQNGRIAESAGRVGIYTPDNPTTYVVGAELTAATGDRVGYSIAVSGDRMAVGAITDDETLFGSGAVQFYDRPSSSDPWVFDSVVTYPDGASEEAGFYGESLDMEGNFLAVGTSTGQFGRVDVYEFTGGNWTLRDSIEGPPGDNLVNSLEFGADVAISTDGDVLVVGMTGFDYVGCDDCGAVRVYDWDAGGTSYVPRVTIDDGNTWNGYGRSIDIDEIPGSVDMRLVIGNLSDSLTFYTISDGLGAGASRDDFYDIPSGAGESLAIDGDRIVTAGLSSGSDVLLVLDRNSDGSWVTREIFSGDLFTGAGALPNNQVDVSGDTIVVGRSDGLGGEVGVFYNDPTYGWGLADVTNGWIDGPVERIQPAGRAVQDSIGRAVAIDDAGANKTIVFGAPGVDDNGEEAGAFYGQQYAEDQTPAPANKLVSPDFTSDGELGSAISIGESVWGVGGVVAADNARQAHRVEKVSDASWEIVQTFNYGSSVIDVDFQESDGKMAVLLGNGNVIFYQEDACGFAPDCSFTATGISGDQETVTGGSISIIGEEVLVARTTSFIAGPNWNRYLWSDATKTTLAVPAGVVEADRLGTDMEVVGDYVFVGAPGDVGADGKVHVWDNSTDTWIVEIDPPAGVTSGRFGHGVSADGTTVAIGAPTYNADGTFDGEAYIYDFVAPPSPSLTLVETLEPSAGSGLSGWGWSIAVDGDSLVVGGTGYEQSGIPYRHGTATAFGFDGANWVETDKFTASDFASADQAGFAVDIVDNDVLVGANLDDNPQGVDAGAIYAYTATDVGPPEPANKITIGQLGETGDDRFGYAIDMDGDWAVVGEPGQDGGPNEGRIHVLERVTGTWTIQQTFTRSGVVPGFSDRFGYAVAIEGNRIVVGSKSDGFVTFYTRPDAASPFVEVDAEQPTTAGIDSVSILDELVAAGSANEGNVYFFRDIGDDLNPTWNADRAPVEEQAGDRFGETVALGGVSPADGGCGFALVSAPGYDFGGDIDFGKVYVYGNVCADGSPDNLPDQDLDRQSQGSGFGSSLATDGDRVVIGHQGGFGAEFGGPGGGNTGLAYYYTYSDATNQITEVQVLESVDFADHNDTADQYGSAVDIDGDTIVIGARNATEQGSGLRAGAAYSWVLDGGVWTETDTFRAVDRALDDRFGGNGVAISGQSVLVGAHDDDNNAGTDAGAVYSFIASAAPDNPTLTFDLNLDPNGPTSVAVAPAGIAVSEFSPEVLEDNADNETSIAAAGLGETDIAESPLSSLPLSSLPLSSLATAPDSALGAIPLIEIDLEGGWQQLFDDAGSPLAEEPLVDLTFADVANEPLARAEFDTERTLAQLNVQGSPLSSLPLSSLVIGSLPLSSLDAEADWCSILAGFIPDICGARPLSDVTVLEATLSAAPLSSLPLSSLPLSSLPLSSLPLSSLPLSSLDLSASPLSSLPLSSLPLSSLGPVAAPLSSLPLSSLPLSSLPLSSLDLNASPLSSLPLSSLDAAGLPLSSLELSNVPLSSLPLSSLEVNGAPLSSLPLSSLPLSSLVLADAPLSSLPLSSLDPSLPDWCTYLAELDLGYDCSFEADETAFLANTTIADLGVQGIPLSSLPLSSLPLSSLELNGSPLSSLPLSSLELADLPLSSLPLSSLPLSSLDLTGTPLSSLAGDLASVPLSSLDVAGSPLSSLPLSSLDLVGTPLSSLPLSSLPLSSLPLSSLPLSSLQVADSPLSSLPLSSLPLSSLDLTGTPLSSLPLSSLDVAGAPLSSLGVDCELVDCDVDSLGDAISAGALDPSSVDFTALLPFLSGIRLGDIADAFLFATRADIELEVGSLPPTDTLGTAPDLDDLDLGDLPQSLLEVRTTLLGQLETALWSVRFDALLGSMRNPATGLPFEDADVELALQTAFGTNTVDDIENLGDATLGDLLAGDDGTFTLDEIGPILGLVHVVDVVPGLTAESGNLGDLLTAGELGDLTLLDLIGLNESEFDDISLLELLEEADAAGALYGFNLADLLLALIGIDLTPFSNIEFTEVEVGELPESLIEPVAFVATFEVQGTTNNKTVEVSAQVPATASYVPGSSSIISENGRDFTTEPMVDGNTLTWTISGAVPGDQIDAVFDVKPTVTIGSTSISATGTIQGTDVNGAGTAAVSITEGTEPNDFPQTTAASEDTIYLTYISSETDNDVFSITVGENDELAIQLSSLTADLDIALYGDPANDEVASALTGASDESPLEPIADPDQDGADSEPLNDFRRLDEEDANLQFIDLSNSPGTETELLVTGALPAGTYYVQVFGANGVTNIEPAALQIQIVDADDRPVCSTQGAVTGGSIGTFPALTGSTANTLILVNEQRTDVLYPGEWADLDTEINEFVTYLNANPQLGIEPIVVSVDGDGTIQAAYDAWDTDAACSPESANAVVQAIIEQAIDPLRGTLEHVLVIGGDQVIPMARLLDVTEIANEYDYRHEFIGDNAVGAAENINALSASFWDRQYLSDEPYGESSARSLGNRFLYVSDIALGRMVETPDEIQGQLQHFQDFNGALDANTAAILGYDFLEDSSVEIAADLAAAGVTVDDELAEGEDADGNLWDKDDAARKVIPAAGSAPDLISLNGHFDHYRALPSDGDKVPGFTNNFLADTVSDATVATPGILQGSVVFSMGCHGGLSVSDLQIADGTDNNNGDWAQTFAADQAIYIGNTGFGYGDTEAVAYTEKLMALFAEKAVRPTSVPGQTGTTTIGQALTFAKNEYASDLSVFSVYDEKALMELTFYGIPFYRVGATPVPADPVPTNTTTPDTTGNESLSLTVDPANELSQPPLGDIYSNPDENGDPQTIVAPGMPIQPSQSFDVSVVDPADSTRLGTVARGALVLDMDSTYVNPTDPVVSTAIFNESENQPEPLLGDVVFPAKPVTVNSSTTPGGDRQTLVVATGQFASTSDVFGVQRLDDNIDVIVYYAEATDTDYTAPTIGAVESTLESTPAGAELTVTLSSTDSDGAVTRVYVLVAADPGVGPVDWVGVDLVKSVGSDDWSGSVLLPAGTGDAEFLVQAVDSSGNVGFATNKARNFNEDDTPDVDPPTPGLEVTVDPANLDAASGWYTGAVDVTVDSSGLAATYVVNPGGTPAPVPVGGVITVDRDGVNTIEVTRADGQMITETIRIDTVAPSASIAPPANGAIFLESAVPNVGFVCQDPSLTSCVATVDGNPIENADPLPAGVGPHTVSVTATDALGNTATVTAGYVVEPDLPVGDPPTIVDVYIDGVALPGEPVDVYGEFVDGVAPYSVEIDWGNGDVCPGVGGCSIESPGDGMPGLFEGSYTYPAGGSFDVEITVTDATGASVSTTLTTATCTIVGTNNNDFIQGTSGADVICGLGGNDWINARGGADIVYGGRGNDTIRGANGADVLYGGRGGDIVLGQGGNDTLIGGQGWDILSGSYGSDIAKGGNGNDVLLGSTGRDTLIGNKGNDQIYGGGGIDDLQGRRGDDFISGSFASDVISGGSGDDTIYGGGAGDTITGGSGEDFVSGGPGQDNIDGGDDDDDLRGDWANDTIEGGDGIDRCRGGGGTDTLTGCEL